MFSWFFAGVELKKEVESLRRDVDRLEREQKALSVEWTDMFDRFNRLHMKLSKRAEREELRAAEATTTEGEEQEQMTPKAPAPTLSPRAQAFHNRILRIRSRLTTKGGS